MIKRIKKVVISVMATGMLFGGIMSPQAEANWTSNARIEAWQRGSRDSNNMVRVIPQGRRVGGVEFELRVRIHSNVVTVVNGVTNSSLQTFPWTTHQNPRLGHAYEGPERSRTIRQGFAETQVQSRRSSNEDFHVGNQVNWRRSFN